MNANFKSKSHKTCIKKLTKQDKFDIGNNVFGEKLSTVDSMSRRSKLNINDIDGFGFFV